MSQQYSQQSPPPGQDGHAQGVPQGQTYENYETQAPPGVPPGPAPGPPAAGGRKKRAYAGQAYEFGAGGNAALGGQQQGGGTPYGGYSAQQDAAGYAQGGYTQNPAAVQQGQTPMYGHQEVGGMGGYQPPQPAYPTQPQPGVAGVTQQFGQMNMNQQPAAPQPQAQQAKAAPLNQLYPTDLSNSPFNVAELDYPPPPAILPPNVSSIDCRHELVLTSDRPVSHPRHTQTARRSTFDQP
jgi:protein transport protein SEC24